MHLILYYLSHKSIVNRCEADQWHPQISTAMPVLKKGPSIIGLKKKLKKCANNTLTLRCSPSLWTDAGSLKIWYLRYMCYDTFDNVMVQVMVLRARWYQKRNVAHKVKAIAFCEKSTDSCPNIMTLNWQARVIFFAGKCIHGSVDFMWFPFSA